VPPNESVHDHLEAGSSQAVEKPVERSLKALNAFALWPLRIHNVRYDCKDTRARLNVDW
jgi:hypothetical protein